MASLGIRSFARDLAFVGGAATASAMVSTTVMPLVALAQKWLKQLLRADAGWAKFIFDFAWGGVVGSSVRIFFAPLDSVREMYKHLQLRALVCKDAPPAPASLVDLVYSMYEDGTLMDMVRNELPVSLARYYPTQLCNFIFKARIQKLFPKYNPKTDFKKFFIANMASGGPKTAL